MLRNIIAHLGENPGQAQVARRAVVVQIILAITTGLGEEIG